MSFVTFYPAGMIDQENICQNITLSMPIWVSFIMHEYAKVPFDKWQMKIYPSQAATKIRFLINIQSPSNFNDDSIYNDKHLLMWEYKCV